MLDYVLVKGDEDNLRGKVLIYAQTGETRTGRFVATGPDLFLEALKYVNDDLPDSVEESIRKDFEESVERADKIRDFGKTLLELMDDVPDGVAELYDLDAEKIEQISENFESVPSVSSIYMEIGDDFDFSLFDGDIIEIRGVVPFPNLDEYFDPVASKYIYMFHKQSEVEEVPGSTGNFVSEFGIAMSELMGRYDTITVEDRLFDRMRGLVSRAEMYRETIEEEVETLCKVAVTKGNNAKKLVELYGLKIVAIATDEMEEAARVRDQIKALD